jgi:hypothetical protein
VLPLKEMKPLAQQTLHLMRRPAATSRSDCPVNKIYAKYRLLAHGRAFILFKQQIAQQYQFTPTAFIERLHTASKQRCAPKAGSLSLKS